MLLILNEFTSLFNAYLNITLEAGFKLAIFIMSVNLSNGFVIRSDKSDHEKIKMTIFILIKTNCDVGLFKLYFIRMWNALKN